MDFHRYMTKTRNGHWILTLVDKTTGFRAVGRKHSTRHGALTEEDSLVESLKALNQAQADFAAGRKVQFA